MSGIRKFPSSAGATGTRKKNTVNVEELVIGVRGYQIAGRSQQFESNQRRRHAADYKKESCGE